MKKFNSFENMTREEKLEYFEALQYLITLKTRNGRFYLLVPELSIVSVSENLSIAFDKIEEQKRALFCRLIDCDAEDEIPLPAKQRIREETRTQLVTFFAKLLFICLLGGVTLTVTGALVSYRVTHVINSLTSGAFVKDLLRNTSQVLDEKLVNAPEDIRYDRIQKIRQYVHAVQPLFLELRPLFSYPSELDSTLIREGAHLKP